MSVHQAIEVPSATRSTATWPAVAAASVVAIYLYVTCWTVVPPDMRLYLYPWYGHILTNGPLGAFAHPFSNYTPPYLYLLAAASLASNWLSPLWVIKLLSLAATGFLALSLGSLLRAAGRDPRLALGIFLLPSVVINSALLGQCDALWAGACLFAVAAMIRGSAVQALLWCGVAIAFKAQAAFLAPFVVGALIQRRAPLWLWPIPALVYVLGMLPAWLAGWPALDLATIYLRQVQWFDAIGNLANPWVWGSVLAPNFARALYPIGYFGAAAAALAIAWRSRLVSNPKGIIVLALLSALALPFLLPKMHERYFFLADVLALGLALIARDRRSIAIAAAVQLASLGALLAYIYNTPAPVLAGSVAAAIALGLSLLAARDYSVVCPSHSSSWWRRSASSLVD